MTLRDAVTFHALDPTRLPGEREAEPRRDRRWRRTWWRWRKAPKGEDYSGPVLFEGMAGAQIFAEVLGRNLALTRRPVADGGRGGGGFQPSELEGRHGRARAARILRRGGRSDADGVARAAAVRPLRSGPRRRGAQAAAAGRKGRAEELPADAAAGARLSKAPTAARGCRAAYGASTATHQQSVRALPRETVPVAELKKKLIELCQARSKPYGIIVRKMDFPSVGVARRSAPPAAAAQQGGRPGQHAAAGLQAVTRTGMRNWCAACASAA